MSFHILFDLCLDVGRVGIDCQFQILKRLICLVGVRIDGGNPIIRPCIIGLERQYFIEVGKRIIPILYTFLNECFVKISIAVIGIDRSGFVYQGKTCGRYRIPVGKIGRNTLEIICPKAIGIRRQRLVTEADRIIVSVGGVVVVCFDIEWVGLRCRVRGRRRGRRASALCGNNGGSICAAAEGTRRCFGRLFLTGSKQNNDKGNEGADYNSLFQYRIPRLYEIRRACPKMRGSVYEHVRQENYIMFRGV